MYFCGLGESELKADPPIPNTPPKRTDNAGREKEEGGAIGTATLLLLSLGGAAVGYKVVKNSKKQKEDKQ